MLKGMRKFVENYLLSHPPITDSEIEQRVVHLDDQPDSKDKSDAGIELLLKRTLYFRELLFAQTLKFQEVIDCLAPYTRILSFRAGDVITVTGELRTHVFWLLQGEVYLFIPTSRESF